MNELQSIDQSMEQELIIDEDLIRINVCGMIYVTLKSTLNRFPDTLLGDDDRRRRYFIPSKNSYFFDRHRISFEAILFFYQSNGELNPPEELSKTLFEKELRFFGFSDEVILKLHGQRVYTPKKRPLPSRYWQRKLWQLFEYPESSFAARIIAICSISFIVLSVIVSCMETMPVFHGPHHNERLKETNLIHIEPWFSLELGCMICFAIEYIIRLISSPNKWNFFTSILNLVDLLAFAPYFAITAIDDKISVPLPILRVVRVARILQIFKFYRHSCRLQVLARTLKESRRELSMLLFFLIIGVILFSSALYYVEHDQNEHMLSIPNTFFYVVVTMTTLGYGDVVPTTVIGKIIGCACAVLGVLAIAVPVPIIVSTFKFIYRRDKLNSVTGTSIPRVTSSSIHRQRSRVN